jgi:restriction system protein
MENEEAQQLWGIHVAAGQEHLFLDKANPIVALGWSEVKDLSPIKDDVLAIRKRYVETHPNDSDHSVYLCAGMLYRFASVAKVGDYVAFPSKNLHMILIGQIISDYFYVPEGSEGLCHQRKVKWLARVPRTSFSQGALYEIGSAMSFFMIKNFANEYFEMIHGSKAAEKKASEAVDETVQVTTEAIEQNTEDFVLKELRRLYKGYALEDVVAELLNAMGYRTQQSPHGGDGSIDIIAYKDELPPRIIVQVKSQDSDIPEALVQTLKGAMNERDYGLYVTLSNFSKNALEFLDKNKFIRGINGTEFVSLLLRFYDQMPDDFKDQIPLKKVFLPADSHD